MKSHLLVVGLCALSTLADAQTEKGQGIWTGSASFEYSSQRQIQNENLYRTSQNNLSFNRGVFFKDNWLAGGGLSIGVSTTHSDGNNSGQSDEFKSTNTSNNLNGFVRRYWGKENWRIFLGGGLSIGYGLTRNKGGNFNNLNSNSFSIAPVFQVGANYYLTDRIGLEALVASNWFPLTFNSVGIGFVILTGENNRGIPRIYEAPQTAKGRWVLGGSFGLNTQGSKDTNGDERHSGLFFISPSIGWFVKKNLLLGVSIPLTSQSNTNQAASLFSYGISPYLKKYISDNRLRPFIEGELTFQNNRIKYEGVDPNYIQYAGISVGAGLAYLLGDRIIVEARLGQVYFNREFYKKETGHATWNGGASATLNPSFTINYVFN